MCLFLCYLFFGQREREREILILWLYNVDYDLLKAAKTRALAGITQRPPRMPGLSGRGCCHWPNNASFVCRQSCCLPLCCCFRNSDALQPIVIRRLQELTLKA